MLFQMLFTPMLLVLILSFPFLSHPLAMGVSLLGITLLISLMMGAYYSTMWISYATILILLGGVLVIFIYVALLASNEYFKKNKFFGLPLFVSTFLFLLLLILNPFFLEKNFHSSSVLFSEFTKKDFSWLSDFYSVELSNLTFFLMLYLFLTLLIVVFNTKNNHGTLRSAS